MVRFLRRRGRGQGKALTLWGRCRNLRCTEPRATSSGYGDLIELVAAALSEGKGRMCGGSAASSAFAGCGLLAGDSVGSIGTRKPQRDADWVTGGCCHQYGGMVGSYEVEGSREFPGYKPSSLRA